MTWLREWLWEREKRELLALWKLKPLWYVPRSK